MGKEKVKKDPAATKFGKMGGKAVLSKYGPDHFKKLAKKMWKKRRAAAKAKV